MPQRFKNCYIKIIFKTIWGLSLPGEKMLTSSRTNKPARLEQPRTGKKDGLKEGIRKGSILIVDDEPLLLKFNSTMLEAAGYSAKTTGNPFEAIELFREGSFDMVITDVVMPEMNGYELLKRIIEVDEMALVIMVSGYSDIPLSDMKDAGAKAFMRKPYRFEELLKTIEKVLEGGHRDIVLA